MNIFQIVEEQKIIRNNTDLANAFNEEEWVNIVNHFVTSAGIWNGSLGPNKAVIDGRMEIFNQMLGMNMEPESRTTSSWVVNARRYGITFDSVEVSWQDIYNKLAPFADAPPPENYSVAGLANYIAPGGSSSTELEFEMESWVNTDQRRWTDISSVKNDFIKPWYEALQTHRPADWKAWLALSDNRFLPRLQQIPDRLEAIIQERGVVTMRDVTRALHVWLQTADYAFENYQNIQQRNQ